MQLRIADTFTDSLARLTGDEQKAVKTTVFDLQVNPESPGLHYHRLDKSKDKHFWSVRVNSDVRIIVHRTEGSVLACYVDHHDKAYQWAERRKLKTHPTTGAAQLVEIRERVQEIVVPVYVQAEVRPAPKVPLFAELREEVLLGYGVPREWLPDVRSATEDTLLTLADHLPDEAAEALLELATGGTPQAAKPAAVGADPFAHPDAQRRFRVMANVEELERALDYPWEKWTVFMHPAQREWVERDYAGPARVSGSAGTGKTIVALHRAVHLARKHPDARVLLTTFSEILANSLRTKLRRLVSNEPQLGERLEVHAIDALGQRLYKAHCGQPRLANAATVRTLLERAAEAVGEKRFTTAFLAAEWAQVVDPWQLTTWEEYRDVKRLGRKTRLPEAQRKTLWSIFANVIAGLAADGRQTLAGMFGAVTTALRAAKEPPFAFAVVDECQDLGVAHLRFLAALARPRPNGLFFAGDLGQRIFQQPFSWKALGVDVRGRSRTLTVNYRTSHQIRSQADRLLAGEIGDVDGNVEERRTISVFNGPAPTIDVAASPQAESAVVGSWIKSRRDDGLPPHEIAIFVRSEAQAERARVAADAAGVPYTVLDENVDTLSGKLSISTMHLAKGLEFRAVAVMACDDEVIPLQARIEAIVDEADLEDVYSTERHLLYVACTRARDFLLVTGVAPASEFLEDLRHRS